VTNRANMLRLDGKLTFSLVMLNYRVRLICKVNVMQLPSSAAAASASQSPSTVMQMSPRADPLTVKANF